MTKLCPDLWQFLSIIEKFIILVTAIKTALFLVHKNGCLAFAKKRIISCFISIIITESNRVQSTTWNISSIHGNAIESQSFTSTFSSVAPIVMSFSLLAVSLLSKKKFVSVYKRMLLTWRKRLS
jgi:hypothetical protein